MFDIVELVPSKYGQLIQKNIQTIKEKPSLFPIRYKNLYYGTQSDILALEEIKEEDLQSQNFGLAMHYMLEMLGNFDNKSISDAKDMMINKYGSTLAENEILDVVNRVTKLVNYKEFLNLLEGDIYKEKAIRYKNNLRYIDLLIQKGDDESIVIDYKSSLLYLEYHIKQVKYYVNAIKNIAGKPTKGYLCYLLADEIKLVKI